MCCGRSTIRNQFTVPNHIAAQAVRSLGSQPGPSFEYIGTTSLTVTGPVSGARYRFSHRGSLVHVDPRDSAALARVPVLRFVSNEYR